MQQTVLVVDDEEDLLELVAHHLAGAGLEVITATRGLDGVRLAATRRPQLILLDIMLPDLAGTEVLRRLRLDPLTSAIPVVFLTARGDEVDRVVGFELGADDYVVKPFSPRELTLRVQALLRRAAVSDSEEPLLLRAGLRLDRARHEARAGDRLLDLTPTEFRLLAYLMARPGRVLTRERILDNVWGSDVYVTDRTVDTHIKRLRTKMGEAADLVETVRGVGYRFQG
jgi:DNA-binding response OmpR family regulator